MLKIIPPISNNIPNRDLAAEQREQTGGLTGNFENFSESWTSVQVSQRLVANARHISVLPVSKRVDVAMKTGSRHDVPRFQRRCCAGEEARKLAWKGISLSLSLLLSLRPSEGMEIDNIPLFEPVSPRPYGVFFYLVT